MHFFPHFLQNNFPKRCKHLIIQILPLIFITFAVILYYIKRNSMSIKKKEMKLNDANLVSSPTSSNNLTLFKLISQSYSQYRCQNSLNNCRRNKRQYTGCNCSPNRTFHNNTIPVSYTHLDVYKRQMSNNLLL